MLAGVGAGVAVLGSALKAAVEDEAEQKRLSQTLIAVAGATTQQIAATEKWIDVTQRATGVADSQLRPALDVLVRSTGDVAKAQSLLNLAMDVSQGTGKDLSTVSLALAKVLEGNTTAAARLVPELAGIAREGASADEMMAALATTFGGQTATNAETAQGKMARLNIAFDEMKEKLGEKLLPVFIKFTDWLIEKAIPKIEEVAGQVDEWWKKQDGLRAAIERGAEIFKALIEDVIAFVEAVKTAVEWIDALAKKINSIPDKIFGLPTGFAGPEDPNDKRKGTFLEGKASGGPVMAGRSYVVGERGPEILNMGGRSGHITPNGGGGGSTFIFEMNGREFARAIVDESTRSGGLPIRIRAAS